VATPTAKPASIDSIGKPGIPPPVTVEVLVKTLVTVVEYTEVYVEPVVTAVVDVATVTTEVWVSVVEKTPPKGPNRSIVDNGCVVTGAPV